MEEERGTREGILKWEMKLRDRVDMYYCPDQISLL